MPPTALTHQYFAERPPECGGNLVGNGDNRLERLKNSNDEQYLSGLWPRGQKHDALELLRHHLTPVSTRAILINLSPFTVVTYAFKVDETLNDPNLPMAFGWYCRFIRCRRRRVSAPRGVKCLSAASGSIMLRNGLALLGEVIRTPISQPEEHAMPGAKDFTWSI